MAHIAHNFYQVLTNYSTAGRQEQYLSSSILMLYQEHKKMCHGIQTSPFYWKTKRDS